MRLYAARLQWMTDCCGLECFRADKAKLEDLLPLWELSEKLGPRVVASRPRARKRVPRVQVQGQSHNTLTAVVVLITRVDSSMGRRSENSSTKSAPSVARLLVSEKSSGEVGSGHCVGGGWPILPPD